MHIAQLFVNGPPEKAEYTRSRSTIRLADQDMLMLFAELAQESGYQPAPAEVALSKYYIARPHLARKARGKSLLNFHRRSNCKDQSRENK
jgi:hypothetical protein